MTRRKHRKDYAHGKSGWVGGNPKYRHFRGRTKPQPTDRKNQTMKGLARN